MCDMFEWWWHNYNNKIQQMRGGLSGFHPIHKSHLFVNKCWNYFHENFWGIGSRTHVARTRGQLFNQNPFSVTQHNYALLCNSQRQLATNFVKFGYEIKVAKSQNVFHFGFKSHKKGCQIPTLRWKAFRVVI